jgi:hypothetical protein
MVHLRKYFNNLVLTLIAVSLLASCHGGSSSIPLPADQTTFEKPVIQPLELGKPRKFDWGGIKAIKVLPDVEKFDINALPAHRYDSLLYKPFSQPVTEAKFDYNSLPSRSLDIDKLPSKPLTCKTYIMAPPKLQKAGMPQLKDPANPFIYQLGEAQGIAGSINYTIKDHNGFFWILTQKALYRYDGENFLLYLKFDQSSNNEQYLMEDGQGRIWLEINGAVEILDIKKGTITRTDCGADASNDFVIKVFEDDQRRIWAYCLSGNINILDTKTQTFRSITKAQGAIGKIPFGFTQDNNNRTWITTIGGGVEIIDEKNKKIKYLDKTNGLPRDSVNAITVDNAYL